MIAAKCPLRISLAGGCTDLQAFIDLYGTGATINFATNLYTYVTINHDIFGRSSKEHKYIINYSRREEEEKIKNIKNDIARECFSYFNSKPNTCSLTADIYSSGSGLASSSSYLISLIKALLLSHNMNLSNENVCGLALNLERKFNPLTGYQDPYGCGIGGLKRLDITAPNLVNSTKLPTAIFDSFKMYLIHTAVTRTSTSVLKKLRMEKCKCLLPLVEEMEKCIRAKDGDTFLEIIREGWSKKKETSPDVTAHSKVRALDDLLSSNPSILAHRLCGAGNGGFFLAFASPAWKSSDDELEKAALPITISHRGAQATKL